MLAISTDKNSSKKQKMQSSIMKITPNTNPSFPLLLRRLAASCALFSGAALLLIISLSAFHIFTVIIDKTLFNLNGISGIEEIVALLSGTAFFMTLPYAQLHYAHIQVDFIPWHKKIISTSQYTSLALFSLLYFSLSIALLFGLIDAYSDHASSSVLSISFWPFYVPPMFALFLSGIISSYPLVAQKL
jgi:hypothetical protein